MELQQLKGYLPKEKTDYTSIELLRTLQKEEIEKIAYELLEWVKDINWPIASDIIEILIPLDIQLVPYLRQVFETNDYEWIDNCLRYLIRKLPKETLIRIKDDLRKLASSNEEKFIEYEIPIVAQEILIKNNI